MNDIHKVIFNKTTQQYVVVSELAKSARKPKVVSAGSVDIVSAKIFLKNDHLALLLFLT
ncbi:ESPR domain-containing protein [Bibersteinia trehalosi]|uniref:ESPR domain-containing protein n=1 Tax=Bibersteinia trehalosi TaxID=47735 RepID=UPI0040459B72